MGKTVAIVAIIAAAAVAVWWFLSRRSPGLAMPGRDLGDPYRGYGPAAAARPMPSSMEHPAVVLPPVSSTAPVAPAPAAAAASLGLQALQSLAPAPSVKVPFGGTVSFGNLTTPTTVQTMRTTTIVPPKVVAPPVIAKPLPASVSFGGLAPVGSLPMLAVGPGSSKPSPLSSITAAPKAVNPLSSLTPIGSAPKPAPATLAKPSGGGLFSSLRLL